jgi:hypothetical protein|tara:strand:+ start:27 stop:176 length:150 start_codon:yes stop_codon:yes gene_type:complete
MNKPVFKDTKHLTERRKCALALAQALEEVHPRYRIIELTERLMSYSKKV